MKLRYFCFQYNTINVLGVSLWGGKTGSHRTWHVCGSFWRTRWKVIKILKKKKFFFFIFQFFKFNYFSRPVEEFLMEWMVNKTIGNNSLDLNKNVTLDVVGNRKLANIVKIVKKNKKLFPRYSNPLKTKSQNIQLTIWNNELQ